MYDSSTANKTPPKPIIEELLIGSHSSKVLSTMGFPKAVNSKGGGGSKEILAQLTANNVLEYFTKRCSLSSFSSQAEVEREWEGPKQTDHQTQSKRKHTQKAVFKNGMFKGYAYFFSMV